MSTILTCGWQPLRTFIQRRRDERAGNHTLTQKRNCGFGIKNTPGLTRIMQKLVEQLGLARKPIG